MNQSPAPTLVAVPDMKDWKLGARFDASNGVRLFLYKQEGATEDDAIYHVMVWPPFGKLGEVIWHQSADLIEAKTTYNAMMDELCRVTGTVALTPEQAAGEGVETQMVLSAVPIQSVGTFTPIELPVKC